MTTLVLPLLPPCAYYIRRLVRRQLTPDMSDILKRASRRGIRESYTLETRLQQLYPNATSHQNVVHHLEQLVQTHQQAKVNDDRHTLGTTAAQILWWLGYRTHRADAGNGEINQSPSTTRIFVVDDTIETIKLVSVLLSAAGYAVESALSGQLAIQMMQSAPPDLALLDINLPGMNGGEVYRYLQADSRTNDIPVIFFSGLDREAHAQIEDIQMLADVGYLQKPFNPDVLLAQVRRFSQQQRSVSSLLEARDLAAELQVRRQQALKLFYP